MATSTPSASSPGTAPALANGKTLLGHPVGLFLLFMVEMWERFSFYGMRAILGLYLKCKITGMDPLPAGAAPGFNPGRGWTQAEASNLLGWYGGMAYLLPILGGFIADKMIGTHRSMLVGGLLIALGHLTLGVSGIGDLAHSSMGMTIFITGLALIVVGTGHFKPSVSVMVNQLYPQNDPRQQSAFGIFYMGINLGALLGTFFVGLIGERYGWHWGFTLAAIGMIAGLLNYIQFRKRFLDGVGLPPPGKGGSAPMFIISGIALSVLIGAMFHFGSLGSIDRFFSHEYVFYTLLFGGLLIAAIFTVVQPRGDRGPVATIFIYMGFNFLFWLAFEQAATSINFFTDEKMNRATGFAAPYDLVPTSWFQNINPFTIIILSPIFGVMWAAAARRKLPVPQPVKIGLGLIFLGAGFVFMVMAGIQAKPTGALAAMWIIFVTYFLHTIGELFLSPTGLSYVSRAAPEKHKSMLMGVWFLSSFLAYTVGGKLAGHADPEQIEKAHFFFQNWGIDFGGGYANFFFLFVFLSVGGGIVIIALAPLLLRLQRVRTD